MPISEHALQLITDRPSLYAFLRHSLGWPVDPEDTFTYDGPALDGQLADRVEVGQIVPFSAGDPFTLFLAEFATPLRRTDLRELLRRVREDIRTQAKYEGRTLEEIVFVCATERYQGLRFAHFEARDRATPRLRVFGFDRGQGDGTRTLREFNLEALKMPPENVLGEPDWTQGRTRWMQAWNVEQVTDAFFQRYKEVFRAAQTHMDGITGEDARLCAQRLFNRLLFLRFLEKKGWLTFHGRRDYLRALWEDYQAKRPDGGTNFYTSRLKPLFFAALNQPHVRDGHGDTWLSGVIGDVPYLNGGLFDDAEDKAEAECHPGLLIRDEALGPVVTDFFYHYNFTVTESTPDDVEVAVDPEMLGKVFEELVTGRHESGSYYTPRGIVQFMCREALKGYLTPPELGAGGRSAPPESGAVGPASSADIATLVDERSADGISKKQAGELIARLKAVKVVDPAGGSGAYVLGMLHELFDLIGLLEVRADPMTAQGKYRRKLEIIQNSLYAVDLDGFAVNIARLRLWLSLAVEFEGQTPEPLPNLDFKVEVGDSLAAPDPQAAQAQVNTVTDLIREFEAKKRAYGDPYYAGPVSKPDLKTQIIALRADIAVWTHAQQAVEGFDWRVEFCEVFQRPEPVADIGGAMNFGGTLTEPPAPGGFDIVLANPPYVRQEDIKGKPHLQKLYTEGVDGKSDLYCYFYIRALQLLRPGGVQIFVVSNSWLDVGYGGKLQKYLLENSHVQTIYDSAVERQFATADINTIISVVAKGKPNNNDITRFVSLRAPFEQAIHNEEKRRELERTRTELWDAGLGEVDKRGKREYEGDKWGGKYLRAPDVFWKILERGKDRLIRLGDIADVRRGFTTGANDFFYVRVLGIESGIARIRCDDGTEHTIEAEYVAEPALVKAREIVRPRVVLSDLAYRLVQLDEDAAAKPHAGVYIRWGQASRKNEKGEEIGEFHKRSTLVGRKPWYAIRIQDYAAVAFPMAHKRRAVIAALYSSDIHIDNRLYGVYPNNISHGPLVAASLISTFSTLCREIYGRANFGQGMLDIKVYEAEDMPALNPGIIISPELLVKTFENLSERPIQMLYDEVKRNDRKILDDVFLSLIGFNDAVERADVLAELYDAACRSVWERQAKAEKTREARQTYDDWIASGLPFGNVDEE